MSLGNTCVCTSLNTTSKQGTLEAKVFDDGGRQKFFGWATSLSEDSPFPIHQLVDIFKCLCGVAANFIMC